MDRVITPLDVLRQFFGTELTADIAEHVEHRATRKELDALREHYRAFRNSDPPIRPRGEFELRPYVPTRASAEFVGLTSLFRAKEDVPKLIGALKHLLLYCHSVALDNPLVLELDYLGLGFSERSVAIHRVFAANILRLMAELRELVDAGVVVFMEPHLDIHNVGGPLLSVEQVEELAARADFSDYVRALGVTEELTESWRFLAVHAALEGLEYNFRAGIVHSGAINPYLPFGFSEEVLERIFAAGLPGLLATAAESDAAGRSAAESRLLRRIVSLQLPNLGTLANREIVAVRDAERFAAMRLGVARALARIDLLRPDSLGYAQEVQRTIHDELVTAQHQLSGEVERSPLLSGVRRGLQNLLISGVPSVLAGAAGGVGAAAGALVFTEGAQTLISWLRTRKPARADAAYAEHVVRFRTGPR